MKQKILVTGGSGFLGKRIVNYYTDKYEIIVPSHREMDIMKEEEVLNFVKENNPDIVIHCAAISDVAQCEKDLDKSYAMNVTGVENIAKACRIVQGKLIFCSSEQIYFGGNPNIVNGIPIPHIEDEKVTPFNSYGKQKLLAEEKAMSLCENAVCLRLSWMYDTERLDENEHSNFYERVKIAVKRGEKTLLPIRDYRPITYVGTVVSNLEKTFNLPGGVYNYGAPNDMSTYETAYRLFCKKGEDLTLLEKNETAFLDNPRNITMDIGKIEKFGIKFDTTIDKLLEVW